jgi:hypothetical protein
MRWLPVCLLVGCATAGNQQPGVDAQGGGGDSAKPDASPVTDSGMQMPDAPKQMVTVTLQQTTNNTVVAANSVACGNATAGYTAENAYYRVFALADHGITSTFHVTQVTFGVQEAGGTQSVTVKIGTYAGTPGSTLNTGTTAVGGAVTQINTTTVAIPATTTGASVPAPITGDIPAGSNLIVEVLSPDHSSQTGTYFYIGATNAGETKPSYVRAPACSINTPTTTATVGNGYPSSHLLITVTGTY